MAGRKPLHTTYAGDGTVGFGYYPTYREVVNAMALQDEQLRHSAFDLKAGHTKALRLGAIGLEQLGAELAR